MEKTDILTYLRAVNEKTKMVYSTASEFLTNSHFTELVETGFIKIEVEDSYDVATLTDKGHEYLEVHGNGFKGNIK